MVSANTASSLALSSNRENLQVTGQPAGEGWLTQPLCFSYWQEGALHAVRLPRPALMN